MQTRLTKVPLREIKKNSLNRIQVDERLTVLVFFDGETYRAVDDVCPHMGGPLSQGRFCARTRTLSCPWHGYVYDAETLALKENPNEEIWARPFAAACETPPYRLRQLRVRAESGHLLIEG
ncbi:MAG TPA: Rieske (2Fe-2S) protein [Pyrinomonadaceae bacterium]|nr:Rieske (2Fe-2S) protein [Pyrinomonadaceae bacterium]